LKEFSLGASLAGAVAGGLLGRQLGKGDLLSTGAGAILGAVGGDIAAGDRKRGEKERKEERRGSVKSDRRERRDRDDDRY
jgi:uncharacterized protein YcfJ